MADTLPISASTTWAWASTTNGGIDSAGVQYADTSSNNVLPVCTFYNVEDPSIYGPSFLHFSSAYAESFEGHHVRADDPVCWYWADFRIENSIGVSYCHDWWLLGSPDIWQNVLSDPRSTPIHEGVHNTNTISRRRTNSECMGYIPPGFHGADPLHNPVDTLLYTTVQSECDGANEHIPLKAHTCEQYPSACFGLRNPEAAADDLLWQVQAAASVAGKDFCAFGRNGQEQLDCDPIVLFEQSFPVNASFSSTAFVSAASGVFTPNIGVDTEFGLYEWNAPGTQLSRRIVAPGVLYQSFNPDVAAYLFKYVYWDLYQFYNFADTTEQQKFVYTRKDFADVFADAKPAFSYTTDDLTSTATQRIFFANQGNVSEAYDQRCFGPPKFNLACNNTWTWSDRKERGCQGYGRCPYTWNTATKTATYCSGRGRCSMTGACVCNAPYVGIQCEIDVRTHLELYELLGLKAPIPMSDHYTILQQLLQINACSGHGVLRFEKLSAQYGHFYCDCFPGWGGTTKHYNYKSIPGANEFDPVTWTLEWYPTDLLLYAAAILSTPTSSSFADTSVWSGTGYPASAQLRVQQCAIWIPRVLGQEPEVKHQQYTVKYNYVTYDYSTQGTNALSSNPVLEGALVYASSQPTFMGVQEYAELQPAIANDGNVGSTPILPAFFRTPNWEWTPDYNVLVTDPNRWGNRTGTCVFGWTGLACDLGCPACNATHSRCVAKNDTIQLVNRGTYWDGERTKGYAVCECDDNWGGQNCSTQVCPQVAGQDQVCGGPTRGVCVDKTAADTLITTIRKCQCFDGYHGKACELASPCPYNAHFGGVCSNPQPAVHENKTHAHGQCNNKTGQCECFPTPMDESIVGYTGSACELRACPSHNGQECSGAVIFGTSSSVCTNRDNTSSVPKCDCVVTINPATRNPATNWANQAGAEARWGIACEHTYPEACNNPKTGLFCSGNGYACVPDNPADPRSKPKCRCNSKWDGEYCENSNCPGGQHCIATALNSSAGNCDDTGRCANGLCYEAPVVGHAGTTLECKCFGYGGSYYAGEACNDPAPECYAGDDVEGCHGPDHGECTRQGDGRYACLCKPWFNSPKCATQTDCFACNQTGQLCQNFHNSTFTCGCDPRYYKTTLGGASPVCQEVCNSTGGQPDAVTNQCRCPSGSVWLDECSDVPAGVACHGSKFKGCRKLCPLYANKYECGLSSYALSIAQCNGGVPINASSADAPPNCTCQFSHTDPERMPDTTAQWFVQSANGSCEPWCIHGTPPPFGNTCNCTNTRFGGPRCNQPACNGHGRIAADGTSCVCDSPWAYSPTDNCATDACAASGGYYPGDANHVVDHCACHLGASGVQHRNASDPDAHLHQCVSLCENGGVPNPATNSSTCTNCSAAFTGVFCDVPLCTHGSTPSTDGSKCVCDRNTWPQFGGTYCNVSLCSNGAPALTSGRGCNCTAVSPHLSGVMCDIDRCAVSPSHGYLNLSVSSTQCQCNIGYQMDPLDSYLCSRDVCNPGVAQACSGGACLHPTSMPGYNCNCGLHATRNVHGMCYTPDNSTAAGTVPCVNGVVLRNHTQQTTSCECYEGWAGLACNITACVLENQAYDPDTNACECIFPFTGALCDQHTCGPHAVGAPICNQTIVNNTVVADRHCRCNCSVGYRQRFYPFPDNQTYPCVLDCRHPFSTLPLSPNATEAPTRFHAVGLVANNWLTDANISTNQCPCAGNFTGALCTGNPKYPERDTNTTKWINDLLEAHKEKWPVWKYVLVAMASALALAGIVYGSYRLVDDCSSSKHRYDNKKHEYEPVDTEYATQKTTHTLSARPSSRRQFAPI